MTKELRLPSAYVEVKENEMEYLDGCGFWSLFTGVVVGALCIAGGIVACATGAGVAGGVIAIVAGVFTIANSVISYLED